MLKFRLKLRNVAAIVACLAATVVFSGCGKDDKEPPKDPLTYDEGVVINAVRWATRNVDKPGTFAAKPENPGLFYQWNSKVGWTAEVVPSDGKSVWNSEWNGNGAETWETDNCPCPEGWRLPTTEELESLLSSGHRWTNIPVKGAIFGTDDHTVFIPVASCINGATGTLFEWNGSSLWSGSSLRSDTAINLVMHANEDDVHVYSGDPRSYGLSVRCVKE